MRDRRVPGRSAYLLEIKVGEFKQTYKLRR